MIVRRHSEKEWVKLRSRAHHAKSSAHTGRPHPNMSTTFMGRSRADELVWRHIPMSADPVLWPINTFVGGGKKKRTTEK